MLFAVLIEMRVTGLLQHPLLIPEVDASIVRQLTQSSASQAIFQQRVGILGHVPQFADEREQLRMLYIENFTAYADTSRIIRIRHGRIHIFTRKK